MNFRRKWLACLWIYYKVFNSYSTPATPAEIYDDYAEVLNHHDIRTLPAFIMHTRELRRFGYIYVIKNKGKPPNFPIPWRYTLSIAGVTKLVKEDLIPSSSVSTLKRTVSNVAHHYNIPTRWRDGR